MKKAFILPLVFLIVMTGITSIGVVSFIKYRKNVSSVNIKSSTLADISAAENERNSSQRFLVSPTPLVNSNKTLPDKPKVERESDFSSIYISAPQPTEIFLVDKNGKRVGKDPKDSEIYSEIEDSNYYLELPIGDPFSQKSPPPNSGVNELYILDPEAGFYVVKLYSPSTEIRADFSVYDREGDISVRDVSQKVQPNLVLEFELKYSPEAGSKIDLKQKN